MSLRSGVQRTGSDAQGSEDGLEASAVYRLKTRSGIPRGRRSFVPSGLPWILPALVVVLGVIYYGIGYTGYISTLNWDGTSSNPKHVGLQNYQQALHDPVFWTAIRHTVFFFLVTFTVQTFLGFVAAALLHSRAWMKSVYRVLIFIPVVLAPAIMAPVFRQIFAADGQFNSLLRDIGLGALAQPWLAQPSTAMYVIMVATIWEWTGLNFILYYAAMRQIDNQVLEAARLDGAGNVALLRRIVWPLVRGTTMSLLVLSIIGAFKTFDIPWLISQGGPSYATEFLGTLIYRQTIPLAAVGYGAAISILLLIVAISLSVVVNLSRGSKGETRE